ncbi:MAG: tetratricopeptide repeat protein, partial [Planctomycetaceae bacterium]|nr:tetratricopeptide repeat protein [Planctomycetaceae bacterium]
SSILTQLGHVQASLGRFDEAHTTLLKSRVLNPANPETHLRLCSVEGKLGRFNDAIASLDEVMRLRPEMVDELSTRANLLLDSNRPGDAVKLFQQMLEQDPTSARCLSGLARALLALGQWSEALEAFRLAALLDEEERGYDSNYLYSATLCPAVHRADSSQLHLDWGDQIAASIVPHEHSIGTDSERCLTIGYLSGDFRNHAVMKFFMPLIRNHSHENFRIYAYSTSPLVDAATEEIRRLSDKWTHCHAMTTAQLTQQIADDRVDVLVDLSGHTAGNRLRVFAMRPAPVQVSLLGYPSTSGLQTMDYRISDFVRENPVSATYFSELLVDLPGGAICFEMRGETPDVTTLPLTECGYVTFGSTHRIEKISSHSLQVWAVILQRQPQARLLVVRDTLSNPQLRRQLSQRMHAAGIPMDRVDFQWEFGSSHLSVYSQIDLQLDVFPWGSSTTALESVWMGVPVPTICLPEETAGDAASLLHFMGYPELVARDADEYVNIVLQLATDVQRLAAFRSSARKAMQSAICDGARYARTLESTYRMMWQRHCGLATDLRFIHRQSPKILTPADQTPQ